MAKNKKIISEDFDFDFGGGFGMYAGGTSGDDLWDTFITPFTDVVQTAIASGLEIGNQALGLFKTIAAGALVQVVPFVDFDYDLIHNKTEERTKEIQSKYKDVFDRTDAALKNNEFKVLSFLLNPGATMLAGAANASAKVAKAAKDKGSKAVDALKQSAKGVEASIDQIRKTFLANESIKNNKNILLENDKEFEKQIKDSKLAQEMKKDALNIIKQRLEGVFDIAQKMDKVTSVEELKKLIKFDNKYMKQFQQIESDEDRQEIEVQLLDDATEQTKNALIVNLKSELENFQKLPFDVSEIEALYNKTISAIKSV